MITGSIDMITAGVTPYQGVISVDLCGSSNGAISQNLSTIPSEVYSVIFFHTGNFISGNIFFILITEGPIIKTLTVSAGPESATVFLARCFIIHFSSCSILRDELVQVQGGLNEFFLSWPRQQPLCFDSHV